MRRYLHAIPFVTLAFIAILNLIASSAEAKGVITFAGRIVTPSCTTHLVGIGAQARCADAPSGRIPVRVSHAVADANSPTTVRYMAGYLKHQPTVATFTYD